MYTTMKPLLDEAVKRNNGVGAFNVHCLEVVPAMIGAAAERNAPVILQVSVSTSKYIGFSLLAAAVKEVAGRTDIPVALHLDHAEHLEDIQSAVDAGFSSVMIDGSKLPLEENIALTRKAAEIARAAGASLEAELGIVGRGKITEDFLYTDPADAAEFVRETGVDALAVAIGTHHGMYTKKTALNFDVLEAIHKAVSTPLVLHGGTGVKEEDLARCIALGMRKLNFGTELNVVWVRAVQEAIRTAEPDTTLRKILIPGAEAMAQVVGKKIDLVS